MSKERALRQTIQADAVDGIDWQGQLGVAVLLATDAHEGLRPVEELFRHIHQ